MSRNSFYPYIQNECVSLLSTRTRPYHKGGSTLLAGARRVENEFVGVVCRRRY